MGMRSVDMESFLLFSLSRWMSSFVFARRLSKGRPEMIGATNYFATLLCLAIAVAVVRVGSVAPSQLVGGAFVLERNTGDELTGHVSDDDTADETSGNDRIHQAGSDGDIYDAGTRDTITTCEGYTCDFRSSCGRAPLNNLTKTRLHAKPFIINGEDSKEGEWPSFARVVIMWKGRGVSSCGGVIVSDKHVLTAAHCVYNASDSIISLFAWVGEHSTWRSNDNQKKYNSHQRAYEAQSVEVPQDYASKDEWTRLNHDWAVMILYTQIEFNDYIQPACLPYGYTGRQKDKYRKCYLIGAGYTRYFTNGTFHTKEIVQKLPVRQVSCAAFDRIGSFVGPTTACYTKAGSEGSPCNGDSGGPVLCIDKSTQRWTVIATSSTGDSYCDGKDFKWASTFARITTLLPEIKAEVGI